MSSVCSSMFRSRLLNWPREGSKIAKVGCRMPTIVMLGKDLQHIAGTELNQLMGIGTLPSEAVQLYFRLPRGFRTIGVFKSE